MRGIKIPYSEQEINWLSENRTLPISEYTRLFCEIFSRDDVTKIHLHSLRKRKDWKTGRTGRFEKGNIPSPLARPKGPNRTSFKKGQTPPNNRELGAERICSKDGYVLVKVAEKNPHTGHKTRFKFKHRVVWESVNGPVPSGMVIIFKDNDKTNCDIDNLMLVSRGQLAVMNSSGLTHCHSSAKETAALIADLTIATNKKSKAVIYEY